MAHPEAPLNAAGIDPSCVQDFLALSRAWLGLEQARPEQVMRHLEPEPVYLQLAQGHPVVWAGWRLSLLRLTKAVATLSARPCVALVGVLDSYVVREVEFSREACRRLCERILRIEHRRTLDPLGKV